MEHLTGLWPPVVTPVRDGAVDIDGIAALVEHMADDLDGIVVTGSCGEGPSLSGSQRLEALRAFLRAAQGTLPVVLGVVATSLAEVHEVMDRTRDLDVVGYLLPPPYYFQTSEPALRRFFRAAARGTDRQVMVYDNPYTTGTRLSVDLLAHVVDDNTNVNHVKVTDLDLDKIDVLGDRTDAALLAGSDEVMHHQLLRGCVGAVTAVPQILPALSRAWFDATVSDGDEAGRPHYDRLVPLVIELLQGPDQYPAVVKTALAQLGVLASDEVLPPLTPLDERRRGEIGTVLATNGYDRSIG